MKREWRQLPFFTVEGWDGFTTWASHDDQGNVFVRRQMIHPDGTVHHKEITQFKLCLPQMKGIGKGGSAITAPQSPERVLAYTLDFVPTESKMFEALRIDPEKTLSFENVAWFPKGESQRRRVFDGNHEASSKNTPQYSLQSEEFKNIRYRQYDNLGKVLDTWVCTDASFQVSTLGRVRYILGENGNYHYTLGGKDANGYRMISTLRFRPGAYSGDAHVCWLSRRSWIRHACHVG
jgi:hypothetical protein